MHYKALVPLARHESSKYFSRQKFKNFFYGAALPIYRFRQLHFLNIDDLRISYLTLILSTPITMKVNHRLTVTSAILPLNDEWTVFFKQ
jgi:hypothetical protein